VRILEGAILAFNVGVDEVELVPVVGETWCPDATAVRVASHIKLGLAVQRPNNEIPICKIGRMVYLYPRIPFECGHGDVVVLAHTEDR
jgi:hypothetical protein